MSWKGWPFEDWKEVCPTCKAICEVLVVQGEVFKACDPCGYCANCDWMIEHEDEAKISEVELLDMADIHARLSRYN